MSDERGEPLAQRAAEFFTAVRDGRIGDVLALADPEFICYPMLRPGLTNYYGHDGLRAFVRDLHAVFGHYQVEITTIAESPGGTVTVHATLRPGQGSAQPATRAGVFTFTFRDGLIVSVDTAPSPI